MGAMYLWDGETAHTVCVLWADQGFPSLATSE
jgi:hypothetical protein